MPRARLSPNQVLTHARAARAAALQLNKVPFQAPLVPLVAARGAREGLWLEQRAAGHSLPGCAATLSSLRFPPIDGRCTSTILRIITLCSRSAGAARAKR